MRVAEPRADYSDPIVIELNGYPSRAAVYGLFGGGIALLLIVLGLVGGYLALVRLSRGAWRRSRPTSRRSRPGRAPRPAAPSRAATSRNRRGGKFEKRQRNDLPCRGPVVTMCWSNCSRIPDSRPRVPHGAAAPDDRAVEVGLPARPRAAGRRRPAADRNRPRLGRGPASTCAAAACSSPPRTACCPSSSAAPRPDRPRHRPRPDADAGAHEPRPAGGRRAPTSCASGAHVVALYNGIDDRHGPARARSTASASSTWASTWNG